MLQILFYIPGKGYKMPGAIARMRGRVRRGRKYYRLKPRKIPSLAVVSRS